MIRSAVLLLVATLAAPVAATAQGEEPLSAIDWLSDVIQPTQDVGLPPPEDEVAKTAGVGSVSVAPIDAPRPDAIGLLPVQVTGFSPEMWRGSSAGVVAARINATRTDLLPAMQEILYRLLLAELDPPADAGPQAVVLLARIDKLLELGAVEQAQALTDRLSSPSPEIFRRKFDIALLLHDEETACGTLRQSPGLSPTFQARIYCLARGGEWSAAALSLETGRALGFVSDAQDPLLAQFLELGLSDDDMPLEVATRPSPLEFRMYESIGRPLPTATMPRAFAHTDLHSATGWKNQIEAAERLAQTGAIDMNRLLGLYQQRKPAASGGVWDRAQAIQTLDGALLSQSPAILGTALNIAFEAMRIVELEVPFARAYCPKLRFRALDGSSAVLRDIICVLAGEWDAPPIDQNAIAPIVLDAAALPNFQGTPPKALQEALIAGFASLGVPTRLQSLMSESRQGEALLRAIEMFSNGANGDLDELSDALIFLRAVGLEQLAQRAAVELILLDRRG